MPTCPSPTTRAMVASYCSRCSAGPVAGSSAPTSSILRATPILEGVGAFVKRTARPSPLTLHPSDQRLPLSGARVEREPLLGVRDDLHAQPRPSRDRDVAVLLH